MKNVFHFIFVPCCTSTRERPTRAHVNIEIDMSEQIIYSILSIIVLESNFCETFIVFANRLCASVASALLEAGVGFSVYLFIYLFVF